MLRGDISLHEAVQYELANVVRELLIDKKVDVNEKDHYGNTPLYYSTILGDKEIVKTLIDAGADVNLKNDLGDSALHMALKENKLEVGKILIDAGAELQNKNRYAQKALLSATNLSDVALIELLVNRGVNINVRDENNQTPLLIIARKNYGESHLKVAEFLLNKGANVNVQDKWGMTALRYGAGAGLESTKLFLKFKADVNIEDSFGETPLFEAIRGENIDTVQLLLDHGSEVNIKNYRGSTPLHMACKFGTYKELMRCLLKHGANVNALDFKGRTPLMCSLAEMNYIEEYMEHMVKSIQFLLKYSDINHIDVDKNNILSLDLPENLEKVILEHIAKLQLLNLPVIPNILETIFTKEKYSKYFKECKKELLMAKGIRLSESWVNFFNLLVDGKTSLKNYAGNEFLVEDFKKSNCESKFPIYGASMRKNMEKGLQRRALFDKSTIVLTRCLPIFNPTHLIIRDVLDCICTKDLETFCE